MFKYKRKTNSLDRLVKAQEEESSTFQADKRFWKPELDKAGNGYAVIRFLPAPHQDGEDGLPWIKYFHHSFKGASGQWYIENSRTTPRAGLPKGDADPVSEYNSMLWNSTKDEKSPARAQATAQKRKLTYISNIYVIKDPANPENEGKVFLYKYGVKIYEKIKERMHPTIVGKVGVDVFDPFDGANFEIVIKTIEFNNQKYPNYDSSNFETPSPLVKNEKEFEEIYNQQHSLNEFLAPEMFKPYDELKKRLDLVLQLDGKSKKITKSVEDDEEESDNSDNPPWSESPQMSLDDDDDIKGFAEYAKNLK